MTRTLLFLTLILANLSFVLGQCPDVDAGEDQLGCLIPSSFDLEGNIDGDFIDFFWTPDVGLSDPMTLNPTATISSTTTYCLVAQSIDYSVNLVLNGDFENGNTDFTTDYDYDANPVFPANQLVEGEYTIGSEPAGMHVNWVDCDDHSDTGTGQMLIANGDESPNQNIWCQVISVDPNTDYAFSAWVASVDPNGPVEIQFTIDGTNIGGSNLGLSTTCLWENFFEIWNSGTNTSITICIEDVNTQEMGNDFAIDDIVFSPICEDEDCLTLTVNDFNPEAINDSPVCEGDSFILEAYGGTNYFWSGPNGFNASSDIVTVNNSTIEMSGIYYVEITDALGCIGVVETEVFVFRRDTIEIFEKTCDPDLEGTFVQNLLNEYFCDSIVTTIVEYLPSDVIFLSEFSCNTSDVGTEVYYLINQFLCDSVVIIETMLLESDSTYISAITCDASIVADTIFLTNQNGCDSLVFSIYTFIKPDSTFIYAESCDLGMVGTIEQILTNESGCDSIVTTIISEVDEIYTFLEYETCDVDVVGIVVDSLTNIEGCDSIVITNITLIPPDSTYISSFTCDASLIGINTSILVNENGCDSIIFDDVNLFLLDSTYLVDQTCDPNLAGTFTDIQIDQNGCDSIIFLEVIWIPKDSTYIFEQTCNPDAAGIFEETFANQNGCDSLVLTEIELSPIDSSYIFQSSCDPNMIGLEVQTEENQYGCDSLIFIETSLDNPDDVFINEKTCNTEEEGVFIQSLFNENGCDSTVTTTITLIPQDTTYLFIETCDTTAVGIYQDLEINQFGCDSIIITQTDYYSDLEIGLIISQPNCFDLNEGEVTVDVFGGAGGFQYSINGGPYQDGPTFSNLSNGVFEISVLDENQCYSSEVFIINAVQDIYVDLGEDFTIELGEDTIINAVINVPFDSLSTIMWTPIEDPDCVNCTEQNISPIVTTSYEIQITDYNGCTDADQLTVNVEFIDDIYIPNIFSPNGDGINDVFLIYSKSNIVSNINSFAGYDRWGNRIWIFNNFSPNNISYSWDGTFKGRPVNPGVFVWTAEIEFINNETKTFSGDVTVVK